MPLRSGWSWPPAPACSAPPPPARAGLQAGSHADLYLEGVLPRAAVARLAVLPEVGAALPVNTAHVRVGGARVGVDGIDPGPAARIIDSASVPAVCRPWTGPAAAC